MRRIVLVALLLTAVACVKKETTGVYRVTSPSQDPAARRAAEQAKASAKQSGEQL